MTITIVGKNPYVGSVINAFSNLGFDSSVVEHPEDLKKLPADSPVLLLENTELNPFLTDDTYSTKVIARIPPLEPIVFIADRKTETPDYIFRVLLSKAVKLSLSKRNVIIFGKSIRGSKPGVEKLYSVARKLGVTFFKYDSIEVTQNEDISLVKASEGTMEVSVTSPLVIDADLSTDNSLAQYAEALQLHMDGGRISGTGRWFLPFARTSRKNVFFLDAGTLMSGKITDSIFKISQEIQSLSAQTGVFARINAQKCAFCYTCYRVCPHSAVVKDQSAAAMRVTEVLCDGCGICTSVCPAGAAELVSDVEITTDTTVTTGMGELLMLCCENSGKAAAELLDPDERITVKSVSCGGSLNSEAILSALKTYANVLVVVCADDACKHFEGNRRARLQTNRAISTLEKLNINPGRVGFVKVSPSSPAILKDAIEQFLVHGRSEA